MYHIQEKTSGGGGAAGLTPGQIFRRALPRDSLRIENVLPKVMEIPEPFYHSIQIAEIANQ